MFSSVHNLKAVEHLTLRYDSLAASIYRDIFLFWDKLWVLLVT